LVTSVVPDWAAFWDREWQAVYERPTRSIVWLDGLLLALVLVITVATGTARGADDAADLYAARCAVCHGADRGGYIAPALSPTSLKRFTEAQLRFKIMTGGVRTLMPAHPSWGDRLAKNEIARLAALIKNAPLEAMSWDLEDISASLTVDVADEDALPRKPSYPIDDMDDLMAVMARGHYAAGEASKVVFFNGATNEQIGEVATFQAPHLADFPRDERWMYLTTDGGYVFKIDLY
jgi:nitrite reductase (NO-forming) / hydroxylamine reductase